MFLEQKIVSHREGIVFLPFLRIRSGCALVRKEAADAYKSATLTYEYLLLRLSEEAEDGTTQPPAVMFTATQQASAVLFTATQQLDHFSCGLDVAVLQCAWAQAPPAPPERCAPPAQLRARRIGRHPLAGRARSPRPAHLIDQSKVNLLLLFNLALRRTGLLPLPRTCKEGLRLE